MSITTKVVSSNTAYGKVFSIQHYVIKFVSDLRQVFFFSPVSPINKTDRNYSTEILQKMALNTKTHNPLSLMLSVNIHLFILFVTGEILIVLAYLLTLPLCAGVSRVRALSPAWTGSPARETLISRTISPQQKNQVQ